MRSPLPSISAGGLTLITLSTLSFAQDVAPPPPPAPASPPAAVYDPQQLPAMRGELDRLTLTPRGDIDGFILKDGTEVKTAPDLSTQIAFAIKPGDRVTVHGLKAAALPLVSAVSITDEATHRTVTDSGMSAATPITPPPPPARPPRGAPPPPAANHTDSTTPIDSRRRDRDHERVGYRGRRAADRAFAQSTGGRGAPPPPPRI